jgi:hypothetical protein
MLNKKITTEIKNLKKIYKYSTPYKKELIIKEIRELAKLLNYKSWRGKNKFLKNIDKCN